jgi:hypothetical protein
MAYMQMCTVRSLTNIYVCREAITAPAGVNSRFGSLADTANGPSFPPAVAELVRPAKVQYSQLESNYGDAYTSCARR